MGILRTVMNLSGAPVPLLCDVAMLLLSNAPAPLQTGPHNRLACGKLSG